MALKIENQSTLKLPHNFVQILQRILDQLPKEHLRGLERVRIVNQISDPRIPLPQRSSLPGLYHPKQGSSAAWLEISSNALFPNDSPFFRRALQKLSFKGNLAAVLFSLVGQHHYITMRHSLRKNQLEGAVRSYTEKHLRSWNEKNGGFRAKLFKPLQPWFEKWARSLQNRVKENERKKKGTSFTQQS